MNGGNTFIRSPRADFSLAQSRFIPRNNVVITGDVLVATSSILPEPNSFIRQVDNMAFPQILAFATACLGIIGAVALLKAFSRG
jgi:hypothetical protein